MYDSDRFHDCVTCGPSQEVSNQFLENASNSRPCKTCTAIGLHIAVCSAGQHLILLTLSISNCKSDAGLLFGMLYNFGHFFLLTYIFFS